MKFEKRFFFSVIPEWKDQYIALEALTKQIEAIKNAALRLVQSVANIKKLEGGPVLEVDLHAIKPDKMFWEMLDENLQKVQTFYETQLTSFLEQFHVLTLQAILMNKMDDYIPFHPGQATKLERELGRLPNIKDNTIGVLAVDQQLHKQANFPRFIQLDRQTNIDVVKERIRRLQPESKGSKRKKSPNLPRRTAESLAHSTANAPSFEDHLRDFQFASAQLEESQQRQRDAGLSREASLPSSPINVDPRHHAMAQSTPTLKPRSSPSSKDLPRTLSSSMTTANSKTSNSNGSTQDLAGFGPLHDRRSMDIGRDVIAPNPKRLPTSSLVASSLNIQGPSMRDDGIGIFPNGHASTVNGTSDIDWKKDDFFDSDDDDRTSTQSHENLGKRSLIHKDGNHSDDSREELDNGHATSSKTTRDARPANGAQGAKEDHASGYSSFFGSEDELSDASDKPRHAIRDHASLDSGAEEADHVSLDSGYASGGSAEGFPADYDEQEEDKTRPKHKKTIDADTETTGSRHHLVPETRMRASISKTPIPATSSDSSSLVIRSSAAKGPSPTPIVTPVNPSTPVSSSKRMSPVTLEGASLKPGTPLSTSKRISSSSHLAIPELRSGSLKADDMPVRPLLQPSGSSSEIPMQMSSNPSPSVSPPPELNPSVEEIEMQQFLNHRRMLSSHHGTETPRRSLNNASVDNLQELLHSSNHSASGAPSRSQTPLPSSPNPLRKTRDRSTATSTPGALARPASSVELNTYSHSTSLDTLTDLNGSQDMGLDSGALPGTEEAIVSDTEEVLLDLNNAIHPAAPRTTFYQLPDPREVKSDKVIKALRSGFSELYRGMHLLKRFAELNVEATDKLLAKYEKNIARGFRAPFMHVEMDEYPFHKATELRALISQTEYVYAQAFTGGHRTPAMQQLRVPDQEEDLETTTLRFGLLFGLSLGFALIIVYMCIVVNPTIINNMRPDLIVFRMLFVATLMLWYWGVDMWIWSTHRINYPFIFEFNTRGHIRHQNIFDIASVFTIVLIGDMMLYMLSALQRYDPDFSVPGFEWFRLVPPETYPLSLVVLLLVLIVFYSVKSNLWLVRTLGRIICAPFFKVVFRDFFLADQLVSISLVLQDIDFTLCYLSTSAFQGGGNSCATNHQWMTPILSTVPQLWRFLQCLRRYYDSRDIAQLQNAGKYGAGMAVAICSSMRSIFAGNTAWLVLWLVFVVIATAYSYLWDIFRDWSIGDRKSENWMLRDQLLYPNWWYYVAAIVNAALRLMWTLTISPAMIASFSLGGKDGATTLLVAVEVSRRAMWNIFRLENEQLNNCGKFRAVQDIPLPLPLKPAVEGNLYQDQIK